MSKATSPNKSSANVQSSEHAAERYTKARSQATTNRPPPFNARSTISHESKAIFGIYYSND
jgi:hypothetical protein